MSARSTSGHGGTAATLLSVRRLSVFFKTRVGETQVASDVSFDLKRGERVGLVGESGCGKTVTGLSILGLLPRGTARATGDVRFGGLNLLDAPERHLNRVRGRAISMIFQEPMSALDPVFTIGHQLSETIRSHFDVNAREARERGIAALDAVGIPLPRQRYFEYPHQLSGGMRQRAMIAIATVCRPEVLIADEATTALDVTIQAQIIDLLIRLSDENGMAILFISHDLSVIAEACHRLVTMYAGQMVEDAPLDDALVRPRHPYTAGLLASMPTRQQGARRLASIPGRVPSSVDMPDGCRFATRCAHAQPDCRNTAIPLTATGPAALARCRRAHELALAGVMA